MSTFSASWDKDTVTIHWSYPLSGTSAATQKLSVTSRNRKVPAEVDFESVVNHVYNQRSCEVLNCTTPEHKADLDQFLEEWVQKVYDKFIPYEEINLPTR